MIMLAGVPGFEPGRSVLETDVLTVDTIPLRRTDAGMGRRGDTEKRLPRRVSASPNLRVSSSLSFLVTSVLAATTAELLKFKTFSRCLFVFGSRVIPTLTITTLENNIIARHNLTSSKTFLVLCSWYFVLCPLSLCRVPRQRFDYQELSTKNQVLPTESLR